MFNTWSYFLLGRSQLTNSNQPSSEPYPSLDIALTCSDRKITKSTLTTFRQIMHGRLINDELASNGYY